MRLSSSVPRLSLVTWTWIALAVFVGPIAEAASANPTEVHVVPLECTEAAIRFTYSSDSNLQSGVVLRCDVPFEGDGSCASGGFQQSWSGTQLEIIDFNNTHIQYQFRWLPELTQCQDYYWSVTVQADDTFQFSVAVQAIPNPVQQQITPNPPTDVFLAVAHEGTGEPGDPCVMLAIWTPPQEPPGCAIANCTAFYSTQPDMSGELFTVTDAPVLNRAFLTDSLVGDTTYFAEITCTNSCGVPSPRSDQAFLFRDAACA